MSFQGDVAGIGLGELLQGLSRGGRDGVLTLDGDGPTCFLGLQDGQIVFLAAPNEDTDVWRERCQRAWADSPDPNLEGKRRAAIAHAARRETLFSMLEAPNLHFRFEPGPLAASGAGLAREDGLTAGDSARNERAFGPAYGVEFLLLEHARIQDESGDSLARDLAPGDMPRALPAPDADENQQLFLEQCDSASTLEEISDRLGWPVRQTRGVIGGYMAEGMVRIADHRELLVAAQRELELNRIGRGSTRLARWVDLAPPGPVFQEGEAELLLGEWRSDRLILALNLMDRRRARAVVRRLDMVDPARGNAHARWSALSEARRREPIIAFRRVRLSALPTPSPETDEVAAELVQIARVMQDKETPWRARPVLLLASTQLYEKLSTRLEVGVRLVQVGLAEHASPIVIEAARELMAVGQAEKAIPALRALVNADANQREASGLLLQARAHKTNLRKRRRNMAIGASIAVIVGVAAVVQVRSQRLYESRLEMVTDALDTPDAALSLLDEFFPNDDSPRVTGLRSALVERRKELLRRVSEAWLAEFETTRGLASRGDVMEALDRALALADPPAGAEPPRGDWPTRQDLLSTLANRLESSCRELRFDVYATAEEEAQEERHRRLLSDVLGKVASPPASVRREEVETFVFFVGGLRDDLVKRREQRAAERAALETRRIEEQQDLMLAAARAHAQAGDLKRAVAMYDRLLGLDGSQELRPLLAAEVQEVRRHNDALERAIDLAQNGDHRSARRALEGVCSDPGEHALPFRVESVPSGARVSLRDDHVRITPFVLRSRFGEALQLEFSADGCEPRVVELNEPADLTVHMFRLPECAWPTQRVVETVPVPAGEDHILADRSGRVVRLARDGGIVWSVELDSLSGIARTPVFLPRRPGFLLVLSEEGRAWLLDAGTGAVEGPADLKRPPVEGPVITRSGVAARFSDGRVALWTDGPRPETFDDSGLFASESLVAPGSQDSASATLVALRRSADRGTSLATPWSDWKVTVFDERYEVTRASAPAETFSVRRRGEWRFVAWEAPNALLAGGRLWVSDEAGVRSFRPARAPGAR